MRGSTVHMRVLSQSIVENEEVEPPPRARGLDYSCYIDVILVYLLLITN